MKQLLFFLLLSVNLLSCDESSNQTKQAPFHFIIQGKVNHGDGVRLSLYIPSQGLDKRLTVTVSEGRYRFEGQATTEIGRIRFEEDILNESMSYTAYPVFIEKELVQFNFDIAGDSLQRYILNEVFVSGPQNRYFRSLRSIIYKDANYRVYADPIKNDSMHRWVYPEIKRKVFTRFDSIFSVTPHPQIALTFFNKVLNDTGPFIYSRFDKNERNQLQAISSKIKQFNLQNREFNIVTNSFKQIFQPEVNMTFANFAFPNPMQEVFELADLVNDHKYTLLYFWWSGCKPCREFNRETTPAIYDSLKSQGIELVSISVDESQSKWINATQQDAISWKSLYAGPASEAAVTYLVKEYPTKVIVGPNNEIIDYEFDKATELLNLLE